MICRNSIKYINSLKSRYFSTSYRFLDDTSEGYGDNLRNSDLLASLPPTPPAAASKASNQAFIADHSYFDTHSLIKNLIRNGEFNEKQAEKMCELFKEVTNYIARDTKKYCVTRAGQVDSFSFFFITNSNKSFN
jgi:dTDP-D-glucose 4,6-dehydratase